MADNHLLTREYKFFNAAKKAAEQSDFKVHVGAIAVYKRKIIASAASQNKTHTLQKIYNGKYRNFSQIGLSLPKVHAEIALLVKLKRMDVPMRDVSVYIYRTCKSRESGLARPCAACFAALREAGIRSIGYSTDVGVALEWIDYKEAR